jgi:hypothetical protein
MVMPAEKVVHCIELKRVEGTLILTHLHLYQKSQVICTHFHNKRHSLLQSEHPAVARDFLLYLFPKRTLIVK